MNNTNNKRFKQSLVVASTTGPRVLFQVFANEDAKATLDTPTWEKVFESGLESEAKLFSAKLNGGK